MNSTHVGLNRHDIDFLSTYASSEEAFMFSSKKEVLIKKYFLKFRPWEGKPVENSYGNKAVIDWQGEPVFAELAVLKLFQENGWNGVWADSYRRKFRVGLPDVVEPIKLPLDKQHLIDSIKERTGLSGGCWDVFVWKGSRILFLELKRKKKDRLQNSQHKWLSASIKIGLKPSSFAIIEWSLDELARI